jgi:hypothetical protein
MRLPGRRSLSRCQLLSESQLLLMTIAPPPTKLLLSVRWNAPRAHLRLMDEKSTFASVGAGL